MKKAKSAQKKTATKKVGKTATKSSTKRKTAAKKAATKAAVKPSLPKTVLPMNAALVETQFRPVCRTERKKLGPFMSEGEADEVTKAHERDFPDHVTDLEEKN